MSHLNKTIPSAISYFLLITLISGLVLFLVISLKTQKESFSFLPQPSKFTQVDAEKYVYKAFKGDLVEVGVKRHSSPSPYLKLSKWKGESFLLVSIPTDNQTKLQLEQGKLKWKEKEREIHFYAKEYPQPKTRKGTWEEIMRPRKVYEIEQEIILKEKPSSNVILFDIETKGLKIEKKGNEYIFYKEEKMPGMSEDLPEKQRKIKHIAYYLEPVILKDAKGQEIEAETEIKNGKFKIIIDKDFLDKAVYPVSVDPSYTVKTGANTYSTEGNTQRKLARKSNGDLWCVYSRYDGTYDQIYASYSTDGGETWTEEQICSASAYQLYPSIAIDSNDNVHVVWSGKGWGTNTEYYNMQYRKRTSSGWQTQEAVTDKNYDQYYPSIAIDSNDNIHVVWEGYGWGTNTNYRNIQYRKRTSSGWQTQEAVTDKNYTQSDPSIAIDSNDNIHVVWDGYGWGTNIEYYNIQYRKRTSSGWQTQEALTDKAVHQQYPNFIWALHPIVSGAKTNRPKTGYAFVWMDGTTVKFYKSSDLDWDTAANNSPNPPADPIPPDGATGVE